MPTAPASPRPAPPRARRYRPWVAGKPSKARHYRPLETGLARDRVQEQLLRQTGGKHVQPGRVVAHLDLPIGDGKRIAELDERSLPNLIPLHCPIETSEGLEVATPLHVSVSERLLLRSACGGHRVVRRGANVAADLEGVEIVRPDLLGLPDDGRQVIVDRQVAAGEGVRLPRGQEKDKLHGRLRRGAVSLIDLLPCPGGETTLRTLG